MVCIVLIFMVIFFLMVRDTGFPFKGVISVFFFKTKQSLFSSEKSEGLTDVEVRKCCPWATGCEVGAAWVSDTLAELVTA